MIGVLIQSLDARAMVAQVRQAEQAAIPTVWAISGRTPDLLPIWAAAAVQTEQVALGTSIVRTWTRHPMGFVQEAQAFEQLAPGRLRLGIGQTGRQAAERIYGGRYDKPLTHLREYLYTIRALLHQGAVDFAGEFVTVRAQIEEPPGTPVLIAAAGPRAFALGGELSDGAISWVAPRRYLVEHALPALQRGAERAGRPAPPIVAHVPIAVTEYAETARALCRDQLGRYVNFEHFTKTWERAGFDPTAGFSDDLVQDLLVSGSEDQVVAGLHAWLDAGIGEILAHPLIDPRDREGSLARCFAAVARAEREISTATA